MLRLLDALLRDVLLAGTSLSSADQVRLQPPDAQLLTDVRNLNQMALDVFLVELRQNRRLRSNERQPVVENGFVLVEQAPERVDCHYLISAWSPARLAPPIVDPTADEHALLYEAVAALVLAGALNPARSYAGGSPELLAWPEAFRDVELPSGLGPPDGYAGLSEFWMTMGDEARWKPVVHYVVTLPVTLARRTIGAMVTTRLTRYLLTDAAADPGELEIQIGGHVRHVVAGSELPLAGAWVRLESPAGVPLQSADTNELGRFTFERLRAGPYLLRTRAEGLGERTRVVEVPSATGEYDLVFP